MDAAERVSVRKTCLGESFIHAMPRLNQASLCCPCDSAVSLPCVHMRGGGRAKAGAVSSALRQSCAVKSGLARFDSLDWDIRLE